MRYFLSIGCLWCVMLASAQTDITGRWKTFDEDTGEALSIIEIVKKNDQFQGTIVDILREGDKTKPCIYCTGALHNQPILGMTILTKLKKNGQYFENGTILDPGNGKTYRCKLWLEEDNPKLLNVRGYIAFLYRTQQWVRVE